MSQQPFWEQTYADLSTLTFGEASQEIRDIASELPAGATVIGMGCGEGRSALYLAECGFGVTAVDISEAGIRKLNALAKFKSVSVRSEVGDMLKYRFERWFDLIVSHGCLHLVDRDEWYGLVDRFKAHTKRNGLNVVLVFTDSIPPPDDLKDLCVGLFQEGEIFSLYSDWEIVLQRSYTLEDEHPDGRQHRHPVNKLVARKL